MAADLRPGERLMAFNPRSGLHGPPDGPALHQSLRYYIEWRTGRALLWRLEDQPSHFERLVVYRGRDHGPTEAYVAMWLAERDLVIESSATYPILGPVEALVVYTVAPAP